MVAKILIFIIYKPYKWLLHQFQIVKNNSLPRDLIMNRPFQFQGSMKLLASKVWVHQKQLIFQQILYLKDLDKSRTIQEDHVHFLILYKLLTFSLEQLNQLVVFLKNAIVASNQDWKGFVWTQRSWVNQYLKDLLF